LSRCSAIRLSAFDPTKLTWIGKMDADAGAERTRQADRGGAAIAADRTKALRDVFTKTVGDPAFLEELRKLNLPVSVASGEEIAEILTALYAPPKPLIERAQIYMTVQ
jgi:hypothetical protein